MKFINDGPDIPENLLLEHEEGNVIWNENVPLPSINDKFGKSRVR